MASLYKVERILKGDDFLKISTKYNLPKFETLYVEILLNLHIK